MHYGSRRYVSDWNDGSLLSLPKLYTRRVIPVDKEEIATLR